MQPTLSTPLVSLDAVEGLRRDIAPYFITNDTTLDSPEPGYVRFRGLFSQDPADCFDALRQQFERHGFTPMIRKENGRAVLIGLPGIFHDTPNKSWINIILLLLTIVSTLVVGAMYEL